MARTAEQKRLDGIACTKRYIENCPMIDCPDCGRIVRAYGKQGVCRTCYAYRLRTGAVRTRPVYVVHQYRARHCVVCLGEWMPVKVPQLRQPTCSAQCAFIMTRLRSYRNRIEQCQWCQRWRLIRSKKLCASCYVMARWALNQQGVYGACSSRINRFKGVPGVLGRGGKR